MPPRNVEEERRNLVAEGKEIGPDDTSAAVSVDEVLMVDWLAQLSRNILERFEDHPDTATIVELTKEIRRGIERRLELL